MNAKEILAKTLITPAEYEFLKEKGEILIEDIKPCTSQFVPYENEHGVTCQRLETTEYINNKPQNNGQSI